MATVSTRAKSHTRPSQVRLHRTDREPRPSSDLLAGDKLRWVLLFGLCGYAGAMFFGTHLPPTHLPVRTPWQASDKLLHFSAYAGLTLLVLASLLATGRGWQRWRQGGRGPVLALLACLALAGCGLIDEFTQPWVGRQFDWWDWAANVAGISTAMTLVAAALAARNWWSRLPAA